MNIKKIIPFLMLFFVFQIISSNYVVYAGNINLFNKMTTTPNKYVDWNNGILTDNTLYATSDFISIESGNDYIFNTFVRCIAYYNINKEFVSGIDTPSSTIKIPSTCTYMRVTIYKTDTNTFTIEKVAPMDNKDTFLAFLPKEICVAAGRTIELYNNQVSWCGNIDNYHFKWSCSVGKAMKRKFTITGTTPLIGEYPLSLTVYDNNMVRIVTVQTIIKIVSSTIINPKNIVTIGDSLTNAKPWLSELRTISGNKFTMVGTKGTAPLKHEGRSGFSANNYLTATSDGFEGFGVHPFWNGTRFNWNYYKTQTGLKPDAVQLFLGTNAMEINPTTNAASIKQIVDYIRQDDATIPIFIVYTLYRGNQDGIGNETGSDGYVITQGEWELEEDAKVFNLMVALNELFYTYTNLYFVPIALCHDSEFNFGAVSTPVNPRAIQTELLPSQATHPQDQGYYQFADIMFSAMAKHLNN